MIFDVFRSILHIAVPFSGVDLNQVFQKVFQFTGEVGRKTEDARSCFLEYLYRLVSGKRRNATGELVDEDAKRPPVDSLVIPLAHAQDDVRCAGVNKKPQKFIFEYWAFSQKSYLNGGCFEEIHICIPKILYLHTS